MPPVFVNLPSTDEQIESLISYFDNISGSDIKFDENGSTGSVLIQISEHASLIFTESFNVIQSFFAEFCALLQKLRSGAKEESQIILNITKAITKDTKEQLELKLLLLNDLYNFFPTDSKFRFELFTSILQFSIDSNNTKSVFPVLQQVELLFKQWNATIKQKRETYRLMCEIRKINNANSKSYFNTLKKYLFTFENNKDDVSVAIKQAKDTAILAIKLEDIYQCDDLLDLRTMKQLQTNEHNKTYQLLQLFVGGKLDSFDSFNKENPEFLQSLGLCSEDCSKKIRLLSLVTLASENNHLSYSQVSKTLNIDISEVEYWIVSAVAAKLISAKMDQINETVEIRHCTQRVFDNLQWKQLQNTLSMWKNNVQGLVNEIEKKNLDQDQEEKDDE